MKKHVKQILAVILLASILACFAIVPFNAVSLFASDGYYYSIDTATTASVYGRYADDDTVSIPREFSGHYITGIAGNAFSDDQNICTLDLSEATMLESIGNYAFLNCAGLSGTVTFSGRLSTLGLSAFQGCGAVESLLFYNNSVTLIPEQCFYNCLSLADVLLPSGLQRIDRYAFANTALTEITVPSSVTYIDKTSFDGCDGLTIYCYTGSYAQQYADENGISYVLIDAPAPTEPPTEPPTEEPTEEPTEAPELLQEHFAGCTLSLTDYIGVNFHMELSDEVLADPDARMRFTVPKDDGLQITEVPVSDATEKLVGDTTYYIFKCSVCAKEMTAQIKAQMIGSTKVGKTYTYSVKKYADYILAHADSAAYTRSVPLVKAMLNYGAYSQLYFDKDNPGTLANDGMDYEDIVLGEVASAALESDYNAAYTVNNVGFTFAGATLSLQSETTLSLFFTSDETLNFSCRHDQLGEMQIDVDNDGTYQIARIRGIKARYLGDNFVLTVKNPSQAESGSVTYSPMLYCAKVLNNDQNTDEYQNVAKALYWYHQAAVAYFG